MAGSAAPQEVVYRVNARDELCHANTEYDSFAAANVGEACGYSAVAGRSLWEFIADPRTREFYREVLRQVRAGRPFEYMMRCDSPEARRLVRMHVAAVGGEVEFRVIPVSEEARPRQALLVPGAGHTGDMLCLCGWCKKVQVGTSWLEVEAAAALQGWQDRPVLPDVAHGICGSCRGSLSDRLALMES